VIRPNFTATHPMNNLIPALTCFVLCSISKTPVTAAEFEIMTAVEKQPLAAATERLLEALHYIGAPLADADVTKLKAAIQLTNDGESVEAIQGVLDPLCLAQVGDRRRQAGARQQAERRMVHQSGRAMLEPKGQRHSQLRTCRGETGV
jgi:hypothetical protein